MWLYDVERETARPLTPGPRDEDPWWSSGGDTIFYAEQTDAGTRVMRITVQASASPVEVLPAPTYAGPLAEAGIVYATGDAQDIRFAPWVERESTVDLGESRPIVSSPAQETFPALSPDQHWLAYMSDESGTWEIYVTDFPDAVIKRRVSTAGGEEPRWSTDGSEIIWRFGVNWLSVSFDDDPELHLGTPALFLSGPFINVPGYSWDLSPDSQRLLVIENEEASEALTELVVVNDFFAELERRVPVS